MDAYKINDEYIMHVRLFDDKIKYATKGGFTIVVLRNGNFGYAKCSLQDNYNKKIGGLKASGRARGIAHKYMGVVRSIDPVEIRQSVLLQVVEEVLEELNVEQHVIIGNSVYLCSAYNKDCDADLVMVGHAFKNKITKKYELILEVSSGG